MIYNIFFGVIVTLILSLTVNTLVTNDLSTYKTYDIGNDSDEIVSCFDYDDTVYSNYLCVEEYLDEQKVENPTDEPIVLRTRVYKTDDDSVDIVIQTVYIDTKVDFIPDWFDEYSNPFYMSSIICRDLSEDECYGIGDLGMGGMNREKAIEQFNNVIDNWEYEDILYYSDSEVVVFPEDNVNNEKYMSLISLNGDNMDEFWSEVEKGIENGEIRVVE